RRERGARPGARGQRPRAQRSAAVRDPRGPPAVTGLARALHAPAPGWTVGADVVVVGSGVAGLTAALRLRSRVPRVLLVTKGALSSGSTVWAQGGIAAALDPADSPQAHLADTVAAGVGLCDVRAAEVLVTEG